MARPLSGGRMAQGGGRSPAPLESHPASLIFPPMTDTEFKDLCEDIRQHGLVDDILLLDGKILEGNNRYRACQKVGVEPRFMDWIGSDPVTFVLSKNLHRRHLTGPQKAAVAVEALPLYEEAAKARQESGKADLRANSPQGEKGRALEHAAKAAGSTRRSAQDAKRVKDKDPKVFEELKNGEISINAALEKSGAMKRGTGTPRGTASKSKAPKTRTPSKPVIPEHVIAQARIRQSDAETKYQSMINAPEGKLNLPFLERASKIQELLVEVTAITPEKAASGVPSLRCREFSLEMAKWWLAFATIMEDRRQAETPDLQPIFKRGRLAAISTVAHGVADLPKEERHLSPTEKAALDWLRQQSEPVTAVMVAVGLRCNRNSAAKALRVLCNSKLVAEVGRLDRHFAYEAVRSDDGS